MSYIMIKNDFLIDCHSLKPQTEWTRAWILLFFELRSMQISRHAAVRAPDFSDSKLNWSSDSSFVFTLHLKSFAEITCQWC